jgi:hypothetical protein
MSESMFFVFRATRFPFHSALFLLFCGHVLGLGRYFLVKLKRLIWREVDIAQEMRTMVYGV